MIFDDMTPAAPAPDAMPDQGAPAAPAAPAPAPEEQPAGGDSAPAGDQPAM